MLNLSLEWKSSINWCNCWHYLPLHPFKGSFISNVLPTLCCFHSLKIRETNFFIIALIKKSLALSWCEFMAYTFPSLTSLIFFLLLKYVISHIQLWASQNDYTYIQCRKISKHFITKVLLDEDLESALLIHLQFLIFSYLSKGYPIPTFNSTSFLT